MVPPDIGYEKSGVSVAKNHDQLSAPVNRVVALPQREQLGVSSAQRAARADDGRVFADQYVDGALSNACQIPVLFPSATEYRTTNHAANSSPDQCVPGARRTGQRSLTRWLDRKHF